MQLLKQKYDIVSWKISDGVFITLTKTETDCRAKIRLEPKNKNMIDNEKEFIDLKNKNKLIIKIKSKKGYSDIINKGISTKWKTFNMRWHKLEYYDIPESIRFVIDNDDVKLELIVHKSKFVPKEWYGSYKNFINRKKSELTGPKRTGYINNANKADYKINNIRTPFSGGRFSPK